MARQGVSPASGLLALKLSLEAPSEKDKQITQMGNQSTINVKAVFCTLYLGHGRRKEGEGVGGKKKTQREDIPTEPSA